MKNQVEFTIDQSKEWLATLSGVDTSLSAKRGLPSDGSNSVYKMWFFNVQWSDCPKEVEDEVRQSWCDYELGNDHYFWRAIMDEDLFESYPQIYFWLKHKGVSNGEEVIVAWWW